MVKKIKQERYTLILCERNMNELRSKVLLSIQINSYNS